MDLILGLIAFLLIFAISSWLHFPVLSKLMVLITNMAVIAIIVIFQPELRVALSKLSVKGKKFKATTEFDKFLDSLATSVYRLADKKTGALIVIEHEDSLQDIVKKSVVIDANFSSELLETIFAKNTVLHDGAVIVSDYKIAAAACILPLAESFLVQRSLGTRHRAGMGISSITDAFTIIVSEETGKVSLAREGLITYNVKIDRFKSILKTLFCPDIEKKSPKEMVFLDWLIECKNWLKRIFADNWFRKLISLTLALIIWFVLDQSLTMTKTIPSVAVRVINVPEGQTISGLQSNGLLNKKTTLTLTGRKSILEEINSSDFEAVVDAGSKSGEWIATISKNNLVSLNPELNVAVHINKIVEKNFVIKLVPLAKEKIPVYVTKPIGEPPKGYQFLDVWPYHLSLPVSGPEEVIKQLKSRGLKLTFNLSDISASQLEKLHDSPNHRNVISFPVPSEWKSLVIPDLSDKPQKIDDAESKYLRIDFMRVEMLPVKFAVPVSLYIPPDNVSAQTASLALGNSDVVETKKGIKVITQQLYAKGVSETFLNVVKDMMEICVILNSADKKGGFQWSVQFVNSKLLEDRYVNMMITDIFDEEIRDMQPRFREEYLRNRFRNYMNRMQLCTKDDKSLDLSFDVKGKEVLLTALAP